MEKTDEITCPEDIFNWMEENVEYGWLDTEGNRHIREMKDFRKQYRTMSVEESMKQKIGTCIEQVAVMHFLLDKIQIKSKMNRMIMEIWKKTNICIALCCLKETEKSIIWSIRIRKRRGSMNMRQRKRR